MNRYALGFIAVFFGFFLFLTGCASSLLFEAGSGQIVFSFLCFGLAYLWLAQKDQ